MGSILGWSLTSIAALAVFSAALLAIRWRRSGLRPMQYGLLAFNRVLARCLWRATINKPLPVADDAGAVIVSNHRSSVEPMLIQLGTKRIVHWMVAREYVEAPVISTLFKALESIPVGRRGVDTASTKQAIRLARQGELVGIFPEGRINISEELLMPGRPGAALVALKAETPVIPCYVHGAPYGGKVWTPMITPARARVTVGEPIDIAPYLELAREDGKAAQRELTLHILREIAALAGAKEFEPRLAGRLWAPADDSSSGEPAESGDDVAGDSSTGDPEGDLDDTAKSDNSSR